MTPIRAVLFDWGETLVRIPGMTHSPERHLSCLERLFEECRGENGAAGLRDLGVSWPSLRIAYITACRKHMAPSKQPPEADITLSDLRQLTAWCNLPSGGSGERER